MITLTPDELNAILDTIQSVIEAPQSEDMPTLRSALDKLEDIKRITDAHGDCTIRVS
jgi:predicted DNA-binding transcriptional regulator YafY